MKILMKKTKDRMDIEVIHKIFIRTGKITFSGKWKSVLLKASSGERCAPRNFVFLVALGGTHICFIVFLTVYQIK